jgi:hypothetical protein
MHRWASMVDLGYAAMRVCCRGFTRHRYYVCFIDCRLPKCCLEVLKCSVQEAALAASQQALERARQQTQQAQQMAEPLWHASALSSDGHTSVAAALQPIDSAVGTEAVTLTRAGTSEVCNRSLLSILNEPVFCHFFSNQKLPPKCTIISLPSISVSCTRFLVFRAKL